MPGYGRDYNQGGGFMDRVGNGFRRMFGGGGNHYGHDYDPEYGYRRRMQGGAYGGGMGNTG